MRKSIVVLSLVLLLIILSGLLIVEMNLREWRSDDLRPHYEYTVDISGLSGTESSGESRILVPIPANKEGEFVVTPSLEDPSFFKQLLQNYVFHTPEKYRKGIYFENTTEALNNKSLDGNWTTSVVNTKYGPMLEFRTNESVLEDISFSKIVVLEEVNNEDPINENYPILYPIISEISLAEEEQQYFKLVSRVIVYETYFNINDNISSDSVKIDVSLNVSPDATERNGNTGTYENELEAIVTGSGDFEKTVVLRSYL